MTFATITTRYPGSCYRCGLAVPVGTRGRYGRGAFYHFASECPTSAEAERRAALGLDPTSPADPRLIAQEQAARERDRSFRRQQAGECATKDAMNRAYAGETQTWESPR